MRSIITYLSFIIALSVSAQSEIKFQKVDNLKDLEQKLTASSAKINTIISDFIQEKHLAALDDTIVTEGKFWFKKENQLRWEYTSPFYYSIVINKGKFYIKDDEKISTYDINSNKAFQEVNNLIISSVQGSLLEQDKFEIYGYKNAVTYMVSLVPKDQKMKEVLNKIELYFDAATFDVMQVKMIESETDYTLIKFINKKLNEDIPESTFMVR